MIHRNLVVSMDSGLLEVSNNCRQNWGENPIWVLPVLAEKGEAHELG